MRIEELDYELPEELIAQAPLRERDASRLLVVDVGAGRIEHRIFRDLPALLSPSLFVLNDTKVFPARLHGRKATGGRIELLLLRRLEREGHTWLAMGKASKAWREGMELVLHGGAVRGRVERVLEDGELVIELDAEGDLDRWLERIGEVPLPPYIRRPAVAEDQERYQTVYAARTGAVAAPTAGLHFTERTFRDLGRAGHESAFVTLHVGPGTFRPVQAPNLDAHQMHEEVYEVTQTTAEAIRRAKKARRAVVAVGTTVVRTLESAKDEQGAVRARAGQTRLFIRPPYRFDVVEHLLTNFHLPRSTLLALVMAFAGPDLIRRAYQEAVEERYRFYSYGDAMLIRGARS